MDGKEYFEKAQSAFINGDHEESLAMFDKALDEGYEPVRTLLSRGAAYLSMQEHDKALQDFDRALEMEGDNERAFYYRGITSLKKGEYQQAVDDLSSSLSRNPGRGAAFLARGMAKAELEQEDEAVADFKQAMAYANVETENFVHMLGGDRTAFQRSMALLEGERGPVTRELNQAEIEKLKRWMER